MWSAYIDGARQSYRSHGVEAAIDYDHVRDGATTSLFVAAIEPDGTVVGGLRVQGPYTQVDQASVVREWGGRPGTAELRRQITARLDEGVIEIKAVWVQQHAPRHRELTAALARAFVHALNLLDVRYALCAAASHAVPRWESSGGVVSTEVAPVAYPDDRYRTLLLWWDKRAVLQHISHELIPAILDEARQLVDSSISAPVGSPSAA